MEYIYAVFAPRDKGEGNGGMMFLRAFRNMELAIFFARDNCTGIQNRKVPLQEFPAALIDEHVEGTVATANDHAVRRIRLWSAEEINTEQKILQDVALLEEKIKILQEQRQKLVDSVK